MKIKFEKRTFFELIVKIKLDDRELKLLENKNYKICSISSSFAEASLYIKTYKSSFNKFQFMKILELSINSDEFWGAAWGDHDIESSNKGLLLVRTLPSIAPKLSELKVELKSSNCTTNFFDKLVFYIYESVKGNPKWSKLMNVFLRLANTLPHTVKMARAKDYVLYNIGKFCKSFSLDMNRVTARKDTKAQLSWKHFNQNKLMLAAAEAFDRVSSLKKSDTYIIQDGRLGFGYLEPYNRSEILKLANLFNLSSLRVRS